MADRPTFMVEDAQIIFRNFAGKEATFNAAGKRNFCVILDPEYANQLIKDGWNVKYLEAREEGEEDTPYLQVAVNFKNYPPRIWMITSTGTNTPTGEAKTIRTPLNEDSVEVLDYADLKTVDIIARAYEWTVNDKSGTKAYLQSGFFTISQDDLELKYAALQEAENEHQNL